MAFCINCGKELETEFIFCPECGQKVNEDIDVSFYVPKSDFLEVSTSSTHGLKHSRMKDKWVSFFLCLFFGVLGIHRFYEGKVFTGILYLFTFGLLGFGWFFDLIRILLKPNPYQVK